VPGIDQAIEVGGAGAGQQLDADLEHGGDCPERCELDPVEMAALDPGHERVRNASPDREIDLAPAAPDACRSDSSAKSNVIHRRRA
jgi:hypothetical protein